jgi:hypothetical protein
MAREDGKVICRYCDEPISKDDKRGDNCGAIARGSKRHFDKGNSKAGCCAMIEVFVILGTLLYFGIYIF